jgi:Flp pilus assembly protein TadB
MLIGLIAAGALLLRIPVVVVAGMVAVSLLPVPLAMTAVIGLAAVGAMLRARRLADAENSEGAVLRQLSGLVAAGATIRSSIADGSSSGIPDRARRLAVLGQPMTEVGSAIAEVLPVNGAAFRAICSFSEHTGAAISTALSVLADRADDAAELVRQRKVALAQVKLSAVVVGLIPIAASAGLVALRGVPEPGGVAIIGPMLVGVALQVVGTAVVFQVASRAR